jgi:hypothetical protein
MEEMECKSLMYWVDQFDQNDGIPLVISVINFIYECMVQENYFSEVIKLLKEKDVDGLLSIDNRELGLAFNRLATVRDLSSIVIIILDILKNKQLKYTVGNFWAK